MNALINDNRATSRRLVADRRSVIPRRSGVERRMMYRREVSLPSETERRGLRDRRVGSDRRQADRRLGVARRGQERRQSAGVARVLLVEGQATVRSGLRRVLASAGHEVIEAHEGHAGLTFLGETPADAVVVNLTLPDMDGIEFIRQLLQCSPNSKVVAIGGRRPYGAPDPLAIATQIGDVRGLRWPFAPDGLRSAVTEVLKSHN